MASRNPKLNLLILLIAGLFFGGGYLYTVYIESDQIKEDFSITTGEIYEFAEATNGEILYTRYKYVVNGKEYERGSYDMGPCEGMEEFRSQIMEIEYPVAYNNQDPEKSRLLISPKQFEEYGITYRESLRGVYEKYWSCK